MNLLKKFIKAKVLYSLLVLAPLPLETQLARASIGEPPLILLPLGEMGITAYRSVPSQTDSTPFYTSIGVRTNPFIVAVSRDLLSSKRVHYGDLLYIEGIGFKHVADTMAKRHRNKLDVWVETREQEKAFDSRWAGRKVLVWLVKEKICPQCH